MKRFGILRACWRGLAIVGVLLLAAPSMAFATASSGMLYMGQQYVPGVGTAYVCAQSTIADVADNRAWTRTAVADGSGCTPGEPVDAGYLGVKANGYRSGGYCDTTGWYFSNDDDYYQWAVGAVLCSNPGGSQTFRTSAESQVWYGSGYDYYGPLNSPTQNY